MVSRIALPDSYAPYYVDCPEDIQLVRQPRSTSLAESEWVHGRKGQVVDALGRYLSNLDLGDFDTTEYMSRVRASIDYNVPVVGWANSGGGWRAAITGVGGLQAIDERTEGAKEAKVGGLFQILTYIAGLSGGAWPVTSPTFHNYEPITQMIADWQLDLNRFTEADVEDYFEVMVEKYEAGFNISVSDFLGRAFAGMTVPGVNRTWSSIPDQPGFKNFDGPFPILSASSINSSSPVEDGLYVPSWDAPWYEWNPFEFGSWAAGFVPTKYVGTIPNENNTAEQCVENLDQTSFVLGTVASAWNYWYLEAVSNDTLGMFSKRDGRVEKRDALIDELVELVDGVFSEYFNYTVSQIANPSIPNAFNPAENITFADGSEAGQSIAFLPLIQPERKLDFIMAWEDDADDAPYSWNNGTNIYDAYVHARSHGLPFPEVPPVRELLARNYTLKPVLFGCDTNLTTTRDATSPIVAYFANSPYSWYTNFSWATTSMSGDEVYGVTQNSFNLVTQGNSTLDSTWVDCLGCAAIERSLARVGMQRSEACDQCFQEHCWDGTLTTGVPDDFVLDPSLALAPTLNYAEWSEQHPDMD
ncbi:lysophospholipase [Aspergillus heteromorphus CBS 117.55]|uniref:Lysophospholipase n=1 Tax=Aspergillus heteromorphus CBS 117.55 TaxID=1448321 RepID=A0A317VWU9_9EURO|nr:lysophospholipase [Aspergillus heteromorphus CBS 117.55]PWY77487.1 lysophospholipase [Aspergillus heteromorphus CBS 117.55]